jgi:hypothetical protein
MIATMLLLASAQAGVYEVGPGDDLANLLSGLVPGDLDPAVSRHHVTNIKDAYLKLRYLVDAGCVLVGHGLSKDFEMINIVVPAAQIVDTVDIWYVPGERRVSLRFLAYALLGLTIQARVHDSVEDARTALALYRKSQALHAAGESHRRSRLDRQKPAVRSHQADQAMHEQFRVGRGHQPGHRDDGVEPAARGDREREVQVDPDLFGLANQPDALGAQRADHRDRRNVVTAGVGLQVDVDTAQVQHVSRRPGDQGLSASTQLGAREGRQTGKGPGAIDTELRHAPEGRGRARVGRVIPGGLAAGRLPPADLVGVRGPRLA